MASSRKATPKPKKISPAEQKRREMAKKKHKTPPKSPLAKKKITNAEAATILKKESKARQIKRMQKDATKNNKPGKRKTNKNLT